MPGPSASPPAVPFDIDGTLVDSNYLHVHAWCRALTEAGIVAVPLDRVGVPASRAVLVGDAVSDAKAAVRAGVTSIGVRSGGVSAEELLSAGATMVFDDPRDLCEHIDASPIGQLR